MSQPELDFIVSFFFFLFSSYANNHQLHIFSDAGSDCRSQISKKTYVFYMMSDLFFFLKYSKNDRALNAQIIISTVKILLF